MIFIIVDSYQLQCYLANEVWSGLFNFNERRSGKVGCLRFQAYSGPTKSDHGQEVFSPLFGNYAGCEEQCKERGKSGRQKMPQKPVYKDSYNGAFHYGSITHQERELAKDYLQYNKVILRYGMTLL